MRKVCAGAAEFAFWLTFEAHLVKHTDCITHNLPDDYLCAGSNPIVLTGLLCILPPALL